MGLGCVLIWVTDVSEIQPIVQVIKRSLIWPTTRCSHAPPAVCPCYVSNRDLPLPTYSIQKSAVTDTWVPTFLFPPGIDTIHRSTVSVVVWRKFFPPKSLNPSPLQIPPPRLYPPPETHTLPSIYQPPTYRPHMAATRKPRSPSTAAAGDHLRFLRPGALARLRDARLRRRSRASRLPPSSSPELEAEPTSPPPAAAGDGEGGMFEPYFVPTSRILTPRCLQRKKLTAAKSVVLFSPPLLTSSDLPVEAVIEFLNQPDLVVAAH
jgi:hypothetical protein